VTQLWIQWQHWVSWTRQRGSKRTTGSDSSTRVKDLGKFDGPMYTFNVFIAVLGRPRYNPEIAHQFCDCWRLNALQTLGVQGFLWQARRDSNPNPLIRSHAAPIEALDESQKAGVVE
jgi:hypothetical protein